MADEAPFQFLHNEVIHYIYKSAENGETENGKNITKLENMGFRVGQGLIERLTKDTARFKDELDIMKFICKDFWTCVFKKQIDNLRTNHQGIYVLQDNKFRLLSQLSAGKQYLEHAPKYLAFTCGLVRGALSNLGVKSIVTAEVSVMPACKFQVMIQKNVAMSRGSLCTLFCHHISLSFYHLREMPPTSSEILLLSTLWRLQ
ncbi:trafficking protein particle complex subunit 6B [Lates japonicus]